MISRGLVLSFSRRCTHQNCWPPIGQKGPRERSYWLHKVGTAAIWSRLQALFKLGAVTFCFGSVRPSLVVQAFGVSFRLAFTMASLTMMLKWKLHRTNWEILDPGTKNQKYKHDTLKQEDLQAQAHNPMLPSWCKTKKAGDSVIKSSSHCCHHGPGPTAWAGHQESSSSSWWYKSPQMSAGIHSFSLAPPQTLFMAQPIFISLEIFSLE